METLLMVIICLRLNQIYRILINIFDSITPILSYDPFPNVDKVMALAPQINFRTIRVSCYAAKCIHETSKCLRNIWIYHIANSLVITRRSWSFPNLSTLRNSVKDRYLIHVFKFFGIGLNSVMLKLSMDWCDLFINVSVNASSALGHRCP